MTSASRDVDMRQGLRLKSVVQERPRPVPAPSLLVQLEPWHRVFLGNFRDRLWPRHQPALLLSSQPAPYWADVFVVSRLPWGRFAESAVFHVAVIAVLWSSSFWWPRQPHLAAPAVFRSSDVAYYDASEYLPPLDTGGPKPRPQQKGDPSYAPQAIISVPPEPDNRKQTIVTPPKLKLNSDVPLPNVVAWGHPATPIPPAATVSQTAALKLPTLPVSVVAPPPEVSKSRLNQAPAPADSVVAPAPEMDTVLSKRRVQLSQPAVVEPPPSVEMAATRKLSDINIGRAPVVAPAPQLPMSEQRALPSMAQASSGQASAGGSGPTVVPPPPSIQGAGASGQDGRLIALNLHPAPPTAVEVPSGNRRGTFAATPEGKPGAAGTPDSATGGKNSTGGTDAHGHGNSTGSGNNPFALPSGLYVGPGSKPGSSTVTSGQVQGNNAGASANDPRQVASATPPPIGSAPRHRAAEMPADLETPTEKSVFGPRRFYAMTLNVPNLNSAGGSWVMHFAEFKDAEKGDLLAPVATRAVDPGYPLELMRQNVQGTVTLSAVIQSDGSVGEVQVLNGIDDRLDEYARNALSHWKFLPALRNGSPVALQAVVMIPFRPRERKTGF